MENHIKERERERDKKKEKEKGREGGNEAKIKEGPFDIFIYNFSSCLFLLTKTLFVLLLFRV